jgi:preprotein translocase subunit SecF
MRLLKIIPDNTNIGFVRIRHIAFAITALLTIARDRVVARGLNMGVDFRRRRLHRGEVRLEAAARRGPLDGQRARLRRSGAPAAWAAQHRDDPPAGARQSPIDGRGQQMVEKVKTTLAAKFPGATFSNYSTVSGKVSGELIQNGVLAVLLAIIGIAIFSWLRYEWQFGVSTAVAIMHDVLMTLGFFALTRLSPSISTSSPRC